jgi:hypothetical protein
MAQAGPRKFLPDKRMLMPRMTSIGASFSPRPAPPYNRESR